MFWLIATGLIAIGVYILLIKPLNHFEERGVPYQRAWPIFGNMAAVLFRRKHFMHYVEETYNAFPEHRYMGYFQFLTPTLMIRDLDLVKRVTVRDFDHFCDHKLFTVTESDDPLMGRNLISLKGQRWRDLRATLSPTYTASKMRLMFTLISDSAEQFTDYFVKETKGKLVDVQLKDIFSRFTNDAFATCAFGLKCDSLRERENEFYLTGKDAANFNGSRIFSIFLVNLSPFLMKILGIKFFSARVIGFFRRIMKETVRLREKEGHIRPDMVHLLMEARKENSKHDNHHKDAEETSTSKDTTMDLTDEDIVTQAMVFFFGGYDTSSNLMCLTAYALALYPDIQKRLQAEVDETLKKCNGKLTYEAVMEMKYMDMVTLETQRLWPLGFLNDRLCVQDYVIEPERPGEKRLVIKEGDGIMIPVVGIHHDAKYYPNPQKFDPERFSDENKHKILPYSYMPFGNGPRACIAARFALLENKTLFAHLLSKFDMIATEKTTSPFVADPATFNPMPKNGFWIGMRQRNVSA